MVCMWCSQLPRPSVVVAVWTLVVVAAFVWRGDLRVATVPAEPARRGPAGVREPSIVRSPAAPSNVSATVSRRGRVFDALGFLVVGAEVVPMERAGTRTDGDGVFQIELAAAATTDLLVRADGQQPAWLRASEGSPDVLALQLAPAAPWDALPSPPVPPSALRGEGTVRTADGRPLAGAFVTAAGTGVWARADDIGRFVIPLPTPTATLLAHEPLGGVGGTGFAGASGALVQQRTRGMVPLPDLIASPALAIRGIVRDAKGQPIVGVPVEIAGTGLRRVVETGSGGAFRVGGLAAGPCRVLPFAWRGALGVAREMTLQDTAVDVDLQLVAAEEVRLRVVDERGGPVAGVYVASNVGGARRGIAQADADGYAAVPVAEQTEFDVRASNHFTPVVVRRFDPDPATLVVAMP